jgi:hypothetical protein
MGFLRRRHAPPPPPPVDEPPPVCPHVTLVAHWENAADLGHQDRASWFQCEACGTRFTPDEVARLRETEARRLREYIPE